MQTKLTLRMDDAVVKKAKAWARMQGISLSGAVAEFFSRLPEPEKEPQLSSWTKRLAGAASATESTAEGKARQDYLDFLEEKYR
jgi:hypothetical protein